MASHRGRKLSRAPSWSPISDGKNRITAVAMTSRGTKATQRVRIGDATAGTAVFDAEASKAASSIDGIRAEEMLGAFFKRLKTKRVSDSLWSDAVHSRLLPRYLSHVNLTFIDNLARKRVEAIRGNRPLTAAHLDHVLPPRGLWPLQAQSVAFRWAISLLAAEPPGGFTADGGGRQEDEALSTANRGFLTSLTEAYIAALLQAEDVAYYAYLPQMEVTDQSEAPQRPVRLDRCLLQPRGHEFEASRPSLSMRSWTALETLTGGITARVDALLSEYVKDVEEAHSTIADTDCGKELPEEGNLRFGWF